MQEYGTAGQATDDNILLRMRSACCILKTAGTHSEYVINIAFARQHWLHLCVDCVSCSLECASGESRSRRIGVAVQ